MPNFKQPGGSTPKRTPPPPPARSGGSPSRPPSPRSAGATNGGNEQTAAKKGWGEVAHRQQVSALKNAKRPAYMDVKTKFMISDGEIVTVQFLDDEPVCVDGCTLPSTFDFYVSRKNIDKSCPLIEAGLKPTWKAGFRILDYRGEYSKELKDFKPDTPPQEKIWLVSNSVATQLLEIQKRKNKPLSKMVLDVTRKGKKKETVYMFETARENPEDDESPVMKPIPYTAKLPPLEEVLKPLSRQQLEVILGNDVEIEDDADAQIDT